MSAATSVCGTVTLHTPLFTVPIYVLLLIATWFTPSTNETMTLWPFSAPEVEPVIVKVDSASSALIILSPAMALKLAVGAVVSKVKVRLLSVEVLPALSVCFTQTVLLPSPVGALKLVPVPVVQVDLLSVLYCQLATSLAKLTFTSLL